MSKIFFESWDSILRTVIISVLAYAALVILLRISGKRTLSKMSAFDMVITVAMGSALATAILTKSVTLADGVTGFTMLIILQLAVTWLSVRAKWFSNMIKAKPVLLVYDGQYQESNMKKERVLKEEILAALRKEGIAALEDVKAVVIENDSSLTVIKNQQDNNASALQDVVANKD